MTVNGDRKWMMLDYAASSLYSVIADGQYTKTFFGRDLWKSLVKVSYLQPNCNREGFNIQTKAINARLGLITNNEHDCDSCDSWIGFGLYYRCKTKFFTCGNQAPCYGHVVNTPAFGFIFVQ